MVDLLEKLKLQHAEMRGLLATTAAEPADRFLAIASELDDFKKVFVDHLYLENKYLYPLLLERGKSTRIGALSTKMLLDEVDAIQKSTISFLNKYDSEEKIAKDFSGFKKRLSETATLLESRIRLEEEGLFVCLT